MIELFRAFHSHYKARTTSNFFINTPGGLHLGMAPKGCAKPYAIYSLHPFIPNDTFDAQIDDSIIRINNYADDMETAIIVCDYCQQLFDGVVLSVTGHEPVTLHRDGRFDAMPDQAEVFDLFFSTMEFRFKIQKL